MALLTAMGSVKNLCALTLSNPTLVTSTINLLEFLLAKSSTSGSISTHMVGISYEKVDYLLKKYRANLVWDDTNKVNFTMYEHNWLNEYIFVEDAKSFQAKLDLAKKYHLRGISVFDLGTEDPHIWDALAQK